MASSASQQTSVIRKERKKTLGLPLGLKDSEQYQLLKVQLLFASSIQMALWDCQNPSCQSKSLSLWCFNAALTLWLVYLSTTMAGGRMCGQVHHGLVSPLIAARANSCGRLQELYYLTWTLWVNWLSSRITQQPVSAGKFAKPVLHL